MVEFIILLVFIFSRLFFIPSFLFFCIIFYESILYSIVAFSFIS